MIDMTRPNCNMLLTLFMLSMAKSLAFAIGSIPSSGKDMINQPRVTLNGKGHVRSPWNMDLEGEIASEVRSIARHEQPRVYFKSDHTTTLRRASNQKERVRPELRPELEFQEKIGLFHSVIDANWAVVQRIFRSTFLPAGFPESVPQEYVRFQSWNVFQDMTNNLRNILSTQKILEGMGVGRAGATSLAATIQWIVRDGTTMLGSLAFTSLASRNLGANIKKWRYFGDLVNDVALTIDMIAPAFPRLFLPLICFSSLFKAMCNVAGGACNTAIIQHWALKGDAADVLAKNTAQHTLVNLLALPVGFFFARAANAAGEYGIWGSFLVLTVAHVLANRAALRTLALRSLNPDRLGVVIPAALAFLESPPSLNRIGPSHSAHLKSPSPPSRNRVRQSSAAHVQSPSTVNCLEPSSAACLKSPTSLNHIEPLSAAHLKSLSPSPLNRVEPSHLAKASAPEISESSGRPVPGPVWASKHESVLFFPRPHRPFDIRYGASLSELFPPPPARPPGGVTLEALIAAHAPDDNFLVSPISPSGCGPGEMVAAAAAGGCRRWLVAVAVREGRTGRDELRAYVAAYMIVQALERSCGGSAAAAVGERDTAVAAAVQAAAVRPAAAGGWGGTTAEGQSCKRSTRNKNRRRKAAAAAAGEKEEGMAARGVRGGGYADGGGEEWESAAGGPPAAGEEEVGGGGGGGGGEGWSVELLREALGRARAVWPRLEAALEEWGWDLDKVTLGGQPEWFARW